MNGDELSRHASLRVGKREVIIKKNHVPRCWKCRGRFRVGDVAIKHKNSLFCHRCYPKGRE